MEALEQTRLQQLQRNVAGKVNTRARQLVRDFRLILRALAHPGVPWFPKLICGCAVLYVVSPIQLIPNFIPILGQLDDVFVVGLAIRVLRKHVPAAVLEQDQNGRTQPQSSPTTTELYPLNPTPPGDTEGD